MVKLCDKMSEIEDKECTHPITPRTGSRKNYIHCYGTLYHRSVFRVVCWFTTDNLVIILGIKWYMLFSVGVMHNTHVKPFCVCQPFSHPHWWF